MTVLVDNQIRMLDAIEPLQDLSRCLPGQISHGMSSAGYDLRLGTKFLIPRSDPGLVIDPKQSDPEQWTEHFSEAPILLDPHSFLLGETVEVVRMPRTCIGLCIGKSTYARVGVLLNLTPIEPGWRGRITLEISNTNPRPVIIYPNEGIAQLLFSRLEKMPDRDYSQKGGRYQGQTGVTLPTAGVEVCKQ